MWAIGALLYGLLKGAREIFKKKAMTRNSRAEVLFFYSVFSFIFILPATPACIRIDPVLLIPVFLKSLVLFAAWSLSFTAVEKLPVGTYGVIDLSRVIFSILLSVIILGEKMTVYRTVGLILVCGGLLMMQYHSHSGKESPEKADTHIPVKYIILVLVANIFNAISSIIDKKALATDLTSLQMLYWYMLFMIPMHGVRLLLRRGEKKESLHLRSALKNKYLWALSGTFVLAEYIIFRSTAIEGSLISVMTLMKQSACIVTIIGGKLFFGEKNIRKKLLCAAVVITGIVISAL